MVSGMKKFARGWLIVGVCSVVSVSCHTTSDESKVPEGPRLALGECEISSPHVTIWSKDCHAYVQPDGGRVLELIESYQIGGGAVLQIEFARGIVPVAEELALDMTVDCAPEPKVVTGDQSQAISYAWYVVGSSTVALRRETGRTEGTLVLRTLNDREIEGSVSASWNAMYDEPDKLATGIRFRLRWERVTENRRDVANCHFHRAPATTERHWKWHEEGYCSPNSAKLPAHLKDLE